MKFKQFYQMISMNIINRFFTHNPNSKEQWIMAQQLKKIDVCGNQLKNQVKYPEICDYGYLSLEFYRSMNLKMKFIIISRAPFPFRRVTPSVIDKCFVPQEVPHLPSFNRRAALENLSFINKYADVESVLNTLFIRPLVLLGISMKFELNINTVSVCCNQIVNEIRYPEICNYGYLSLEFYHSMNNKMKFMLTMRRFRVRRSLLSYPDIPQVIPKYPLLPFLRYPYHVYDFDTAPCMYASNHMIKMDFPVRGRMLNTIPINFTTKYGSVESVVRNIYLPIKRMVICVLSRFEYEDRIRYCCNQIVNEIRYPEICNYGYLSEYIHFCRIMYIKECIRLRLSLRYRSIYNTLRGITQRLSWFCRNSMYGVTGLSGLGLKDKYKFNTIIKVKEKKRYVTVEDRK